MNKRWHERHKMRKGASLAERVRWHVAHARNCGCRSMPASVVAEIKRTGSLRGGREHGKRGNAPRRPEAIEIGRREREESVEEI
jgi:hypothetical protein